MARQSESINELVAALAVAQGKLRPAGKNSRNPHLKNEYADLESIWAVWREVGPANGLAVIQSPTSSNTLVTTLAHSSGQWVASEIPISIGDGRGLNASQVYGSALSYAKRYALAALVGVVASGEDDDGAGAGHPQQGRQQAPAGQGGADLVTEAKLKALFATLSGKGLSRDAFRAALGHRYKLTSSKGLTAQQYAEIMKDLEGFVGYGEDAMAAEAREEQGS